MVHLSDHTDPENPSCLLTGSGLQQEAGHPGDIPGHLPWSMSLDWFSCYTKASEVFEAGTACRRDKQVPCT